MSHRILLCVLPLSFAGLGCASTASVARPDPVQAECPPLLALASPVTGAGTQASPPSVAEMQAVLPNPALDGAGSQAETVRTEASPVPQFPDRQSVEALDRLAQRVPVDVGKHGASITLPSDDYFDAGNAHLAESARWRLDDVAHALADQAGRSITVRVYTDTLGDRSESLRLSQARAAALRDYLVAKGVPANSVRAEGLGADHPVADNASAAGRASNRRIELVIEVNHDSIVRR